jgi:hypothetical protein
MRFERVGNVDRTFDGQAGKGHFLLLPHCGMGGWFSSISRHYHRQEAGYVTHPGQLGIALREGLVAEKSHSIEFYHEYVNRPNFTDVGLSPIGL